MSRWFVYVGQKDNAGSKYLLQDLLYDPKGSIIGSSDDTYGNRLWPYDIEKPENDLRKVYYFRSNDGLGYTWYTGSRSRFVEVFGRNNISPIRYRTIATPTTDPTSASIAANTASTAVVAYIRSATSDPLTEPPSDPTLPQSAVSIENAHPFIFGNWSFVHCGNIPGFLSDARIQTDLVKIIDPVALKKVVGTTDTEHLAALFFTFLEKRWYSELPDKERDEIDQKRTDAQSAAKQAFDAETNAFTTAKDADTATTKANNANKEAEEAVKKAEEDPTEENKRAAEEALAKAAELTVQADGSTDTANQSSKEAFNQRKLADEAARVPLYSWDFSHPTKRLIAALAETFAKVIEIEGPNGEPSVLNVALTDGNTLIASRYRNELPSKKSALPPTWYIYPALETTPVPSQVFIASVPAEIKVHDRIKLGAALDEKSWQEFPAGKILAFVPGQELITVDI